MSFAVGVFYPKSRDNIGTLFRSAQNFGASMLFTIGQRYKRQASDTQKAWRHIPVLNFLTWEEYRNHAPMDWVPVVVELCEGAMPLQDFKHPRSAVYILGPEDGDVPPELCGRMANKVFIPSKRCLNLAVAGSIVMYDRYFKVRK
jgi:tRNA (guanosine-2'-O-)-methyltransferase